jgi:molecular chaperone DnaK
MPQIEVSFDIDANGIIHVTAKDRGTGNEQQIRIEGGSGLSEDDVQRMIKDAESHADEAHRLRELADAKNMAETLAYQTEKSLSEHREKLDPAEAATLEGRIMELKQVLETGDIATIQEKTQALNEAAQPLAQALYADAQAQSQSAPTGTPGDGGPSTTEDEVVEDADYEVIDDETATKA